MSGFEALLRLQEHDIIIDQLEHRLATLPERKQVADNARAVAALDQAAATVQASRDVLARDQRHMEDQVTAVEAKAAEVYDTLYGGKVTSPKELQAFQADFDSLKRRQSDLEDEVIELMEAAEPLDGELASLAAQRGALIADGTAAAKALAEAEASVGSDLEAARSQRAVMAGDIAPEQVASYDRLRAQFGGIAVARLVGSSCGGCHLTLSSMALDDLRKAVPGAVTYCDECGRILVRS
jgi:predicted  nucleic acid-binding Zn-ribbon protein